MRRPRCSGWGPLLRSLARVAAIGAYVPGLAFAAEVPGTDATAAVPGMLVRWSAPQTIRCRMLGRSWAARNDTCYFPIDLEQKPGLVTVGRQRAGRAETARIAVGPRAYGTQEITLPDIPQANPSPSDLRRDAHERTLLAKVFHRRESSPRFALPLGPPARPLPDGKSFGVDRVFNGKPAPQPHTGTDYPVPAGSPVLAVADGTVTLAQDLFYPGNAVFIDHGDGLLSMYFHLADMKVTSGQEVRKGDRVGSVGTTGRSTGPHLFFGIRWHNARIDPKYVLGDPARIPDIGRATDPSSAPARRTDRRR
jgi:murein DD-endopeptidase MepM/ murein hydrolase activator NlpD